MQAQLQIQSGTTVAEGEDLQDVPLLAPMSGNTALRMHSPCQAMQSPKHPKLTAATPVLQALNQFWRATTQLSILAVVRAAKALTERHEADGSHAHLIHGPVRAQVLVPGCNQPVGQELATDVQRLRKGPAEGTHSSWIHVVNSCVSRSRTGSAELALSPAWRQKASHVTDFTNKSLHCCVISAPEGRTWSSSFVNTFRNDDCM
jgi:hypothetical protein